MLRGLAREVIAVLTYGPLPKSKYEVIGTRTVWPVS